MKKSTIFIGFLLLGILIYFIWNEYHINNLNNSLSDVENSFSNPVESDILLSSFQILSSVYTQSTNSNFPFYHDSYENLHDKCKSLLIKSPSLISKWIVEKREKAWAYIGSKESINTYVMAS